MFPRPRSFFSEEASSANCRRADLVRSVLQETPGRLDALGWNTVIAVVYFAPRHLNLSAENLLARPMSGYFGHPLELLGLLFGFLSESIIVVGDWVMSAMLRARRGRHAHGLNLHLSLKKETSTGGSLSLCRKPDKGNHPRTRHTRVLNKSPLQVNFHL